jgi:membrane-associated protease RseP (regulator of RpoE activity)
VDVKLDGAYSGIARVDVGSPSMIDLHTPFVKEHDLLTKVGKSVPVMGGGVGGTFQSKVARMHSIEIGPYRLASPLVGLSTTDQGALASEDYVGNIGNGVLDRFTITLDYEHRQLWLEPGRRYGARTPYSRFGGELLKERGEVRVAFVIPGSPAAAAGLVEGDVVTAIDGAPIAGLDPDQVEKHFEDGAPGSRIALTVLRGGKPRTMNLRLRDLL